MEILSLNSKKSYENLVKFIAPYEFSCVQLGSYLRKQSPNIYFLTDQQEIVGLIYVDRTLFHCLPDLSRIDSAVLKSFLITKSRTKKIKCISGLSETTEFLINLLQDEISLPYQTNHYKLMTASKVAAPPEALVNDDEIKRCTENDMEQLLCLQREYLNTEVTPGSRKVSDAEVAIGLRQILRNQVCLALFSDGEPVAKANTNAIGLNWVQLGGIFTSPLYRRNGYSWHLISTLCNRIFGAGKNAALFVKDINVPAIMLYKRLGFIEKNKYEIAYY